MPSEAEQARERVAEMLRWDEIHARDCETNDPPPGPFPCDCDVPRLLRTLLDES